MALFKLLDRTKRDKANAVGRKAGYGECLRCHDSWAWKPHHTTYYNLSTGCFPLCDECWLSLTPEQRLPFYAEMVADFCSGTYKGAFDKSSEQIIEYLEDWPQIRDAVLAGK